MPTILAHRPQRRLDASGPSHRSSRCARSAPSISLGGTRLPTAPAAASGDRVWTSRRSSRRDSDWPHAGSNPRAVGLGSPDGVAWERRSEDRGDGDCRRGTAAGGGAGAAAGIDGAFRALRSMRTSRRRRGWSPSRDHRTLTAASFIQTSLTPSRASDAPTPESVASSPSSPDTCRRPASGRA